MRCRNNEALVCTVGKVVIDGNSRFYLAELSDRLFIAQGGVGFWQVNSNAVLTDQHQMLVLRTNPK